MIKFIANEEADIDMRENEATYIFLAKVMKCKLCN